MWSPDGRSITFAAEDQGALGVYRVGTQVRRSRRCG